MPVPAKQVCDWPKIWTAENFATPELCAWLVSRGKDKLTPSMMFTGQKAVFLAVLREGRLFVQGETGDGIFFASMRDGEPDPQSLHGARVVTRGEKYILSQWIHDRPFNA